MSTHQTAISAEETARRGDEIYERIVRPTVEASSYGKVVAIDIWSSAYAVDDNARLAAQRLREQHPDAEVWFVRVGQPALHRVGARPMLTRA